MLTFFFTGVPHPDRADSSPEEKAGMTGEEILRKRKEDITISAYSHGPYGAQQCFQCHSTSQSATFRTSIDKKDKSVIKAEQNVSGRLVMPIKELCIDCHASKSVKWGMHLTAPTTIISRMNGNKATTSSVRCHDVHTPLLLIQPSAGVSGFTVPYQKAYAYLVTVLMHLLFHICSGRAIPGKSALPATLPGSCLSPKTTGRTSNAPLVTIPT